MDKPVFIDTVTEIPADFLNLVADIIFGPLNQATTVGGVLAALNIGTLAAQNANAVAITGGTLDGVAIGNTTQATGKFSALFNYGTPTDPHHAANKAYVDAQISGAGLNPQYVALNYLALAGGTLTGPLTLAGAPTAALHAATKQYVDTVAAGFVTQATFSQAISAMASESYVNSLYAQQAARELYHDSYTLNGTTNTIYLREKPSGDVMVWYNGQPLPRSQVAVSDTYITLPFNPNGTVETLYFGATGTGSQFVGYLPLAGGTMTGALLLAADPIVAMQAATKQYVDNAVTTSLAGLVTQTALASSAGAGMVGYQTTTVAAALTSLFNTTLTDAPNNGSTYARKNGAWSQITIPTLMSQLQDVNVTEGIGIDNYVLAYNNATAKWIAKQLIVPTALNQMTDVNVVEGAGIDGMYLKYSNSAGKWQAAAVAVVAALSGLSDVNVSEGAGIDKYALVFDNSSGKWIAQQRKHPIAIWVQGMLSNAETLYEAIPALNAQLPAGLTGSVFVCDVAPTASMTITLNKNGSAIGTLTWAAGATTATVSFTTATTFNAGVDKLSLVGPATADTTAANFIITLLANLV